MVTLKVKKIFTGILTGAISFGVYSYLGFFLIDIAKDLLTKIPEPCYLTCGFKIVLTIFEIFLPGPVDFINWLVAILLSIITSIIFTKKYFENRYI